MKQSDVEHAKQAWNIHVTVLANLFYASAQYTHSYGR